MNDLTETTETLQARMAAQTAITDTRDALMRTALSLPNNLQYLAEGGGFASMLTDLVRAIADARLAKNRVAVGYLRGTDADKARWDAECETATRREVTHVMKGLQGIAGG